MSFYTYEIANIQQFFKNIIVHGFVLFRTNFVSINVDLNLPGSICKDGKRSLSHDTLSHQPAG